MRDYGSDRNANAVDDADLVDLLHGELDADARTRVEQQVRATPAAAARLEQLRRREERLSALLREADPDDLSVRRSAAAAKALAASGRGPTRPLLRAAAVIALLGAAALSVEPVRAALGDGLRSIAHAIGLTQEPARVPAPRAGPASAALVTTTLEWSDAVFTVELPDAGGTVDASFGDAGAAAISHAPDVAAVISSSGVRLSGSRAVVTVHVPPGTLLRVVHRGVPTDHALSGTPVRIQR